MRPRQSVFLALLLCVLFGFTPARADEATFLHYWTGPFASGVTQLIQTPNAPPPGQTRVKAVGFEHEAFKVSIRPMLASSSPPDMFSWWAGARTQALVEAKAIQPIDDLWARDELSLRFSPSLDQACVYDNKHYAVPVTQHLVAFFYNTKVFARLGLTPPRTWAEFSELCSRLRSAGVTPVALGARERWPAQFWFDYLLLRTAGPDVRRQLMDGRIPYTDEAVIRTMALWKGLIDKGWFNATPTMYSWSDAAKMVSQGDAAMTLTGTWIIALFEGTYGLKAGQDFDFFAFPEIDPVQPGVCVGPVDVIVLASQARPAAREALAWLAGDIPQMIMSTNSGALAPSLGVRASFYPPLQRRVLDTIAMTPYWAFNYDLATPQAAAETGLSFFSEFLARPQEWETSLHRASDTIAAAFANP